MSDISKELKLFISYSHVDEPYFKVFNKGLQQVAKNTEHFSWSIWTDENIHVGDFWDDTIQNNIKDCNVALLLVSLGFMASKYIQEREYKEFIKRYKAKGIVVIPIVFKPCDFNRWEDLDKLQFFKPQGSTYGKPEVTDFTYADLIKFTDSNGILIPIPDANIDRYHLDLVKKIEISYNDFLQNQELTSSTVILPMETEEKPNLSDYPKLSPLFTGRKEEQEKFKSIFETHRLFAIEGLGGTGKTQFTSKCIEDLIKDKNKIVWLDGSKQSKFDVFVEGAGYGDVLKGEKKTESSLFHGLKDLIERDERIIFWDNYNDYEDSTFSRFISFTYPYLRKATFILITKTEPLIDKVTSVISIKLEGLNHDSFDYAKKIRKSDSNYSSISDSDLKKICLGVEGHPLAIESSMWLMGHGKSADDIMKHMPEFSGLKKIEDFSKRLFLDIYNHQTTSDDERDCFLKCSVFKGKITLAEIKYLYDGKDVFNLLVGLHEKLLLRIKDNAYEMHPLVRSFSYEKLTDKKVVHKKAGEYFVTQREQNLLNAALEEKIFYHLSEANAWEAIADSLELKGRMFIEQGHLGLLNEILRNVLNVNIHRPAFEVFLGDIATIQGEWNKAQQHYELAKAQDSNKQVKAEGIVKYAEIVLKKGNVKEALCLFQEVYEFSNINNFLRIEARALNDIGLIYDTLGELDKAYENYNKGLNIRIEINDEDGIIVSLNNIASIYSARGLLKKALENYENALATSRASLNKEGEALSLNNIGIINISKGELNNALVFFKQSLSLYEAIGNKQGIAESISNIANVEGEKGYLDIALNKYHESLNINEEIGNKDGIASSLGNIGITYNTKGDSDVALEYFERSLKIYEQIGEKKGIASSFGNIGLMYTTIGNHNKALVFNNKSLKIEEEIGHKKGIAITLGNIGSIYRKKNDTVKALEYQEKSLKMLEEIGSKVSIAGANFQLAITYQIKNDFDKSLEYNNRSLNIAEEIGNKESVATTLCSIGTVYYKKKQFDTALIYLLKSLSITNLMGAKRHSKTTVGWINGVRDNLGLVKFKTSFQQAYDKLDEAMRKNIPSDELLKLPVHVEEKPGRNDPCPCGSGKKYKKCHGN